MRGIIFIREQDFINWNNAVTIEMLAQGQIMQIWCEPIISRDDTNRYFGTTESEGIRRTIIEQFLQGFEEVEILSTDETWFNKAEIPNSKQNK